MCCGILVVVNFKGKPLSENHPSFQALAFERFHGCLAALGVVTLFSDSNPLVLSMGEARYNPLILSAVSNFEIEIHKRLNYFCSTPKSLLQGCSMFWERSFFIARTHSHTRASTCPPPPFRGFCPHTGLDVRREAREDSRVDALGAQTAA